MTAKPRVAVLKFASCDGCQLSLLDAEDVVPGAYVLEVSSPGLERRFFSPGQMSGYLGQVVDVRLTLPQEGRRHLRGLLAGVEGPKIVFLVSGGISTEPGRTLWEAFDRRYGGTWGSQVDQRRAGDLDANEVQRELQRVTRAAQASRALNDMFSIV